MIEAGRWGLRVDCKDLRGFTATELMRGRKDRDEELERAFNELIKAVNRITTRIEKERIIKAGLLESKKRDRSDQEFFDSASIVDDNKGGKESEDDEVENFEDAVEVLDET